MNSFLDKTNEHVGTVLFLSDLIGIKAFVGEKKVGKLDDLVIKEHEKLAEVTHLIISRPFGYKSLLVPLERVAALERRGGGRDRRYASRPASALSGA